MPLIVIEGATCMGAMDVSRGTNQTTGAESLVRTLVANEIDVCFANPGTSEMHFVAALDRIPGIDCVLGLHETVVTGMADGYYRIAGKPACTLLHCGPGLANGIANLHNARRAGSGIVNIVGDQATYHRQFDAPLTADTEALARTVSSWVRTSMHPKAVGRDAAAAVQAARTAPGNVATLILPSDASWGEGGEDGEALPPVALPPVDPHVVESAARVLREGRGAEVLILLGGRGLLSGSQRLAWRLACATGASVLASYIAPRVERGRRRLPLERVAYAIDAAIAQLSRFRHIVLVNALPPVGFFAYPGKPSIQYDPEAQVHVLSRPDQDPETALQALVDELGVPEAPWPERTGRPDVVEGPPTPEGLARTLAALLPENAIVSDESVSFGRSFYAHTHEAAPHDWLHLTGGSIGDGLPVATGAAIAGAGRRVVSLQADGSAMYSLQSLWTQARQRLPVTTVIIANRNYNILIGEYKNVGAAPGPTAMNMLSLSQPALNWVALANGHGVEAAQATTLGRCADLMRQSFRRPEPFLIELVV